MVTTSIAQQRSPWLWMITGLLAMALISGLNSAGSGVLALVGAVLAVLAYTLVMHLVARRSTPEIARPGAAREALHGAALGAGFIGVSVALITLFGVYSFTWSGRSLWSVLGSVLVVGVGAAVTEELMFRGFALQALEQLFSSRTAVVVTGMFFGVAHLLNPGANLWSALAIAIEAGVLLGVAFLWRRSIWFVVGLHFAWNSTEQLLGIPVSGKAAEGLLTADVSGPALLTGGSFGLEASIIPVLLGVALTVPMFVAARRRGMIVGKRSAR